MKRTHVIRSTALLGALLAILPHAALPGDRNLLSDPSFEQRLSGSDGGWNLFEISLFSKNHARSGNQSMYSGGFSRSVAFAPYFIGNASGAFQEVPAEPGSRWRLTGYGLTPAKLAGTPAYGIVQLSFFDADGKDIGTVETAGGSTKAKVSNEINNESAVNEWILLDTGIATAPQGTATVQAFTLYVDYARTNRTQGVYFDDLTLCLASDDDTESNRCDPV